MIWSLAVQWAELGCRVRMVTTTLPGRAGPFREDDVEVVPLPGTAPGRYSSGWWVATRDYWLSQPTPPRAVLSVSAGAYSVARARARHPRIPFVLQAHGTSAMEIRSKLRAGDLRSLVGAPKNVAGLMRDLGRYRDFDRIVAVGQKVAASLTAAPQRWSIPPGRVRLIPNGVRPAEHGFDPGARRDIRNTLGITDRMVVVSCVGRLHVQKRLDRVLRAAARLRDWGEGDRFRFLLVGDGPDEPRLRAIVRDLNLTDLVTFVGRVKPGQVRGYHAAADVALLTTARLEGLPMTVLEALASGLPCVVPTGVIGSPALDPVLLQVDPRDDEQLATVLRSMVPTAQARNSRLPAEFTLEHCARSYLALFEELRGAHLAP